MSSQPVQGRRREGTVLPPEDLSDLLNLSHFLDQHTEPAVLVGPDGEQTPLPAEVYTVLVEAVHAMKAQRAVTIAPVDQRLTTQQTADLLGISRPTVIKLIDQGDLSCEKLTGSRHRRLRLADVLAYQRRRENERDQTLRALVEDAEDAGLYDVPAADFREAVRAARRH
ncbi:helix-turn-helix domain-containing protein [Ruania zhangjianzhongii]|uniref:helix-turn-helix domain-containing protein n=1 Tax=Ruania zhangjianzhongii TaxID=2603206 RepID=UPI0011CC11C2|nr:helix-turn-helix domain-containing protein [Ruania zhangjianzhongii]